MKRYELCTVVDAGYLARALVLHRSLVEQGVAFRLVVLCMEETTLDVLRRLAPSDVEPIALAALEQEDPALPAVKPTRTLAEYCWTLKPSLLRYLFAREPGLRELSYVDADQMVWSDPAPVYAELGDGSVLIVPQRTESEVAGRYNAGLIVFRRTDETDEILSWWRERCLEWSFAGVEAGGRRRFGDQGYLSDWPDRFSGVRVLAHPGGGVAPWNYGRSALGGRNGALVVDGVPLVFFHYHSLRLYSGLRLFQRLHLLGDRFRFHPGPVPLVWSIGRWYPFTEPQRTLLWEPYVGRISDALAELRSLDPGFASGFQRLPRDELAREVFRAVVPRPARDVTRRAIAAVRPGRPSDVV
jgi:hypothetical protein